MNWACNGSKDWMRIIHELLSLCAIKSKSARLWLEVPGPAAEVLLVRNVDL